MSKTPSTYLVLCIRCLLVPCLPHVCQYVCNFASQLNSLSDVSNQVIIKSEQVVNRTAPEPANGKLNRSSLSHFTRDMTMQVMYLTVDCLVIGETATFFANLATLPFHEQSSTPLMISRFDQRGTLQRLCLLVMSEQGRRRR